MEYIYFISFECKNICGLAKGNTIFKSDRKIRTLKDITSIQKIIERNSKVKEVLILNINLLDNQ